MKADPARETEKQTEDRYKRLYRRSSVSDTPKGEEQARRMGAAVWATAHPYPKRTQVKRSRRQGGRR